MAIADAADAEEEGKHEKDEEDGRTDRDPDYTRDVHREARYRSQNPFHDWGTRDIPCIV